MVLMRPFVPYSDDDQRQQLTAFMAARMDPENYGELLVYEMPSGDLPEGPGIAAAAIQTDERVSTLETQLGRGGSEVRYGNLLLVPVDEALVYVQPFYVVPEDQTRQVPLLERVIANYGDQVVIANTLAEAMEELFGEQPDTREDPDAEGTLPGTGEETPPEDTAPSGEEAEDLLAEAQTLFEQADEALADGDLGTYQERVDDAGALVDEAVELLGGTAAATSEGSDTTEADESTETTEEGSSGDDEAAEPTTSTTAEATAAAATSTPA
jgi:uncharacterized membrane protein (UPF0182 family)